MKAYSEDLRERIVEAVERGMGKSEVARTFGMSLSSVKRYVGMAHQGRPLTPKKPPGLRPKIDESEARGSFKRTSKSVRQPPCPRGGSSLSE
jgi:transposase